MSKGSQRGFSRAHAVNAVKRKSFRVGKNPPNRLDKVALAEASSPTLLRNNPPMPVLEQLGSYSIAIEKQWEYYRWLNTSNAIAFYEEAALRMRETGLDPNTIPTHTEGRIDRDIALTATGRGGTYFVGTQVQDMLGEVAKGVPGEWVLRPEHMPEPHGFVWFAKPVSAGLYKPEELLNDAQLEAAHRSIESVGGKLPDTVEIRFRALTWTTHWRGQGMVDDGERIGYLTTPDEVDISKDARLHGFELHKAVYFVGYADRDVSAYAERFMIPMPPVEYLDWSFGHSISDHNEGLKNEIEVITGEDAGTLMAHLTPQLKLQHFIAASLTFMEQKILVGHKVDADRATRRRLEREYESNGVIARGWKPEHLQPNIHIVILRKTKRGSDVTIEDGEHKHVEWSCRWLVGGHWRLQYYRSTGMHKSIYIQPYVKGPDNMPMKLRSATLHKVIR